MDSLKEIAAVMRHRADMSYYSRTMRGRAYRRAQMEKQKRRAEEYYHNFSYRWWTWVDDRTLGMRARTRKSCSCSMCQREGTPPRELRKETIDDFLDPLT